MRAAVVHELGDVPTYGAVADPVAGDGQVVARVRAASIKNIDRAQVAGTHYSSARIAVPVVPGIDGVVSLADGRRLYAASLPGHGLMAEQTLVDPSRAIEVPHGISDAVAAALPNPGLSAWFALEYAGQVRAGGTVLVLGATGVTGSLAVQLARSTFGAGTVVAAGRNAARLASLRAHGADATVDLTGDVLAQVRDLHEQQPFDLVLDYLWGEPAEQTLRALGSDDLAGSYHRTRYVQIGEMAGASIDLPAGVLRSAGIEIVGMGGGSIPKEALMRVQDDILPRLLTAYEQGLLHLNVQERPLEQVSEAWTDDTPSGTRVVLVP